MTAAVRHTKTHFLKCRPAEFEAVALGDKTFEYRKDDRGFSYGDTLVLQRWDPQQCAESPDGDLVLSDGRTVYGETGYTGERLRFHVTYILRGVPEGFVVMGIRKGKR